jgi:hypothetical protein
LTGSPKRIIVLTPNATRAKADENNQEHLDKSGPNQEKKRRTRQERLKSQAKEGFSQDLSIREYFPALLARAYEDNPEDEMRRSLDVAPVQAPSGLKKTSPSRPSPGRKEISSRGSPQRRTPPGGAKKTPSPVSRVSPKQQQPNESQSIALVEELQHISESNSSIRQLSPEAKKVLTKKIEESVLH